SVADVAWVGNALVPGLAAERLSVGVLPQARVLTARSSCWDEAGPEPFEIMKRLGRLESASVALRHGLAPAWFDEVLQAQETIQAFEQMQSLHFEYTRHSDALQPKTQTLLAESVDVTFDQYMAARSFIVRVRRELDKWFCMADGIPPPASPGEAPGG